MIRVTKHILKYQTSFKNYWLRELFEIYEAELRCYVEAMFLGEMLVRTLLSTKKISGVNIQYSNWKAVTYKQASKIIRGRGIHNEVPPILKNFTAELDVNLFNIEWKRDGEFDGFVKVRLPFIKENCNSRRLSLRLPFKHHKRSRKFEKDWTLLKTINIKKINGSFYLLLFWKKEAKPLKTEGRVVGFDCGYRHFLIDSDGNFYGTELKQTYEKLARQKHGSKNHKQTLAFRDNKVNEICNRLSIEGYREVIVEDLKCVRNRSKFSKEINNKLQYWTYAKGLTKVKNICEENGVLFTQVDPAYTSQCCPKCGNVDSKNRVNERFKCTVCQYENHADVVGAINILNRGKYNSSIAKSEQTRRMSNFISSS